MPRILSVLVLPFLSLITIACDDASEECERLVEAVCSDDINECGVDFPFDRCVDLNRNNVFDEGFACDDVVGTGDNYDSCLDALTTPGCLSPEAFSRECQGALQFED